MTIEFNSTKLELNSGREGVKELQITLKAARVNAGLTLVEAAQRIGIGKDTLIKWEKKPWTVNVLNQKAISDAYNISIDFINFLPKN